MVWRPHSVKPLSIPTALTASCLGVSTLLMSASELSAAPRDAFPGRRVGGGTRGECASRPVVHVVPTSSVYAPGASALIAVFEGPSPDPQPLELILRVASTNGAVDASIDPLFQRVLPAAQNRLILLKIPPAQAPLTWETSYVCGSETGDGEFGFITTSAPPALSLLVPGEGGQDDQSLQQLLNNLQRSCGGTTALAPMKSALLLGDEVIDETWPQMLKLQCF